MHTQLFLRSLLFVFIIYVYFAFKSIEHDVESSFCIEETSVKKKKSRSNQSKQQDKNTSTEISMNDSEYESEEKELEEGWKKKNRSANTQSVLEPPKRELRSKGKK